ncbi:hypothetical protein [Bordetella phage vB_BbrM_PHB04]|uniref:Uncharacterized protein n=1 Tax=Bordetella phage vB_BbrM_PHB04 TaxID=2029657 RepID=A0A291L9Z2_9CAUD|nr:hypothetical protein HOS14_gp082 [Bordetella phage vB_BbrM_PHB04]ATI15700.1 hypothetical protein [Bordetella phage vB_BbrM_PHB04]
MTPNQLTQPYNVAISSTCSGASPVIYEQCQDPDTGENWNRELGQTNTAFVADYDNAAKAVTWNEEPHSFKLTDEGQESIALAYLFAAAPTMRDALREVLRTSHDAKLRGLAMAALDATAPPSELPQADPETC